jgi:hypothetical protein
VGMTPAEEKCLKYGNSTSELLNFILENIE